MIESAASDTRQRDAARIPEVIASLEEVLARTPAGPEAAPPGGVEAWRVELVARVDDLEACFAAHVMTDEEPEGFIPQSEQHAPRLIHALEVLRSEHEALHQRLLGLREEGHDPDRARSTAFMGDVRALTREIEHHLDVGNRLAMEIANSDIGSSE